MLQVKGTSQPLIVNIEVPSGYNIINKRNEKITKNAKLSIELRQFVNTVYALRILNKVHQPAIQIIQEILGAIGVIGNDLQTHIGKLPLTILKYELHHHGS